MYSRCLASSDRFDDDGPIRFSSLWFANFDDLGIQDKLKGALDRVPSRKFVFLSHQLSARMSKSSSEIPKNQQNLQGLVLRMCQEHPFHSLYQVFCLRPEQPQSVRRTSSRFELPSSQSDRGGAASAIFDRLLSDPTQTARIRSIEQVCNASLEWAKYPVKHLVIKKPNSGLLIPDALPIRKLRDVQVPVITCRTPIDPTLKYNDCIWISRYHPEFVIPGGINHPKISICLGSNGEQFKQLFKGEGNDDMRQDAVMEQVFHLCNMVLRYDKETRRRNLNVRDYKVLPLATQAGVIEFVGNTVTLQKWLQEAHNRYRPDDIKHGQVLVMLKQTREKSGGKTEAMVKTFQQICQRTQPVMRHYFTEKHKTPITWFAMRLNYTRSVATTSIVGHILGLGDRHVQNILIDNGSGEVVHIDLGIAFDQGKLLRIPERVPFRMTRDMVDGMGKCGTQGVFQRCAEETLRVLRDRSDVILTVLEVFKHDPLHSWTASELKIKKVQDNTTEPTRVARDVSRFGAIAIDLQSGSADEAADRALAGVARKLDKALSVEYTVNELIAEATDIVNLATIYQGWSPEY
jgi:ataxia telangiectasia mutated family protein